VPDAIHDNIPEKMGYEAYRGLIRDFVKRCAGSRR